MFNNTLLQPTSDSESPKSFSSKLLQAIGSYTILISNRPGIGYHRFVETEIVCIYYHQHKDEFQVFFKWSPEKTKHLLRQLNCCDADCPSR
jgi:hypothetical protein